MKLEARLRRLHRERHLILGLGVDALIRCFSSTCPIDPRALRGWSPFLVRGDRVVWVDMRGQLLNCSTGAQDYLRAARKLGSVRTTSIGCLDQVRSESPDPSGFVFHIARCGSTLLRNMLAAVDRTLALSEPMVVHDVVHSMPSTQERERRLAGTVRALCQPYRGDEEHFFVKLSSSCTIAIDAFARCFPTTPMVYLYRDPVEVMVAALHEGGCSWMQPRRSPETAERVTGVEATLVASAGRAEYAARVIASYYEIAGRAGPQVLPINYSRLLETDTLHRIAGHFGYADPSAAASQMLNAVHRNAKRSGRFEPDGERRRLAASQRILDAAERWCGVPYRALERISSMERPSSNPEVETLSCVA